MRTAVQRRADACGPLARGEATLACQCGRDGCPAATEHAAAATATLKPLTIPTGVAPDPGYRPSATTREFIRWRDLTCR